MPAYIVATVRITDSKGFKAYAAKVAGLSERFGGISVAKGPVAEVLEGDSPVGERVVVTRFDSADAARGYIASPEYQSARENRAGTAEVEMRLLIDPA